MKRFLLLFAIVFSLCLTPARAVSDGELSQSAQVVAQALGQMGYTEGENESTIFGQRYGYPNGFWCDMFVSWCADEAHISKAAFPRSVNCARHCELFTDMGRYHKSAARGGIYTPLQGDLVLFYNKSGRIHHVGLVLYTENGTLFTVEGNALTTRLDYPAQEVSDARISETEPNDYVTVNTYSLTDPRLPGYAVPAYTSRDPLPMEGFVDLGRYSGAEKEIEAVTAAGLMRGTSSHTFSPRAGMPRGEFVKAVMNLYGFSKWAEFTPEFDDVTPESEYYSAVMAARSAGLLLETEENLFNPDLWISGEDALSILSAIFARLRMENRTFEFTPGDLSQILTPYTTRGDIAQALYALCLDAPLTSELFNGILMLNGEPLDWPVRVANGMYFTPLPCLLKYFPELTSPDAQSGEPLAELEDEDAKAFQKTITLETEDRILRSEGFVWNGTPYVAVDDAAMLLEVALEAAAKQ